MALNRNCKPSCTKLGRVYGRCSIVVMGNRFYGLLCKVTDSGAGDPQIVPRFSWSNHACDVTGWMLGLAGRYTVTRRDSIFDLLPLSQRGQQGQLPERVSPWDTRCILLERYLLFLSCLSRSLADRWGTTVDFTASFLHSSRLSAFRSMVFHPRPVHSLMLSSHRFLCLPLRLPPWTVPCSIVLASPDDRVTCPYHFSLRLFTDVRRSSYGPMAFPIQSFTCSLVMCSLYEIPRSFLKHLISNACILLSMSAVMVHVSHAYTKIRTWPGNASV